MRWNSQFSPWLWISGVSLLLLCGPYTASAEPPSSDQELRHLVMDMTVEKLMQQQGQLPTTPIAPAYPFFEKIRLHGSLRNETAYRVSSQNEFTKLKNQLILAQSTSLSEGLRFKASERFIYDSVYDITDNFPRSARSDQKMEAEFRDTYLDYSRGPFDVRLGKQQIVWGDAAGLFFADVVNAKDLREYVLPDFDLIRIPQWGLDAEFSQSPFHVEIVWLAPEFDKLGVRGAEFEFPRPVPPGVQSTLNDPVKPPLNLNDSEAGLRLSTLLGGWDVSTFYFYTWDKFPVLFRRIDGNIFRFVPEYRRARLLGGSFSKAFSENIVLKGELVFDPHKHLTTFDTTDPDGIVQRNVVDYLIGLDHKLFKKVDTSVQLMQRVIANHPDLLFEDEVRTHISFWAKTDMLNGKLELEFLAISGLTEQDLLFRPKVTYRASNNVSLRFGTDIFQGHRSGLFGQFDKKSRVYTELTCYF